MKHSLLLLVLFLPYAINGDAPTYTQLETKTVEEESSSPSKLLVGAYLVPIVVGGILLKEAKNKIVAQDQGLAQRVQQLDQGLAALLARLPQGQAVADRLQGVEAIIATLGVDLRTLQGQRGQMDPEAFDAAVRGLLREQGDGDLFSPAADGRSHDSNLNTGSVIGRLHQAMKTSDGALMLAGNLQSRLTGPKGLMGQLGKTMVGLQAVQRDMPATEGRMNQRLEALEERFGRVEEAMRAVNGLVQRQARLDAVGEGSNGRDEADRG